MEENINVQGVEAQESTEPATTATEPVNPTENASEAPSTTENATENASEPTAEGKTEEDSRFANVRRKAEEDAKAKYGAEIQKLNERIRTICAGYTNPDTGKPIETVEDYLVAYEAQQRNARNEELRSKGIDPKIIEEMVSQTPDVQQAKAIIQQSRQEQAQRQLEADVKAISEVDSSIKTVQDLVKHPSYQQVYNLVTQNGLSVFDAYKLANYDSLSAKSTAAAKQAAINQVNGKNHLEATGSGLSTNDEAVDVPASLMSAYKQGYPDLSEAEIKAKYNEFLKKTGGK
jgi:hypothetical protein